MSGSLEDRKLAFGTTVYDEDGNELGRVRGFDEHGFYVTLEDGLEGLSRQHIRAGQEFGEAELMWRCWVCGDMGQLNDDIPEICPDCGAAKEDIYYWTED